MLQRAPRPHSRGVVPLGNTNAFTLEVARGFDAGSSIDVDVRETKLAVGKGRYGNVRKAPGMGAYPRRKAAVPSISVIFPLDDFTLEAFNLHSPIGDGHVRVYGRLAEIKADLGIGHG